MAKVTMEVSGLDVITADLKEALEAQNFGVLRELIAGVQKLAEEGAGVLAQLNAEKDAED